VARASSLGKEMHQNDLLSKLNNELDQEDVYKLEELMAPPQWPLNAYDSKLEMSTAYYEDRLALSTGQTEDNGPDGAAAAATEAAEAGDDITVRHSEDAVRQEKSNHAKPRENSVSGRAVPVECETAEVQDKAAEEGAVDCESEEQRRERERGVER